MPPTRNSQKSSVIVTVPASLVPLMEQTQVLLDAVAQMPRGGDLEGLIESHLGELNRQFYELCLARRAAAGAEVSSEDSEAFPPSGLPEVPDGLGPGAVEGAHGSDAAR